MNYISQLNKDQVTNFLKDHFPESKNIFVHFDTFLEPIIHVIVSYESDLGDDLCHDFILSQFEVRAFPRIMEIDNKAWRDFMVSLFGSEYDDAYIKHHVAWLRCTQKSSGYYPLLLTFLFIILKALLLFAIVYHLLFQLYILFCFLGKQSQLHSLELFQFYLLYYDLVYNIPLL